jgi:phosphate-selective porin OprO/OprP
MFRRLFLVLLGGMVATWSAPVVAQVPPAGADSQQFVERLGKMEQRLDWLTQQNNALLQENKLLTEKLGISFPNVGNASPQGITSDPPTGAGVLGSPALEAIGPGAANGQPDSPGDASQTRSAPAAGGSKASGGGDPTSIGRAQVVGNQHLGKVGLNPYYDFDDGGIHLATKDGEFSFGIAGMTQLDGMLYARPTPGIDTSSCFYNPRSRIYFEGTATKPITWSSRSRTFSTPSSCSTPTSTSTTTQPSRSASAATRTRSVMSSIACTSGT